MIQIKSFSLTVMTERRSCNHQWLHSHWQPASASSFCSFNFVASLDKPPSCHQKSPDLIGCFVNANCCQFEDLPFKNQYFRDHDALVWNL